jgi:peptide deformylase
VILHEIDHLNGKVFIEDELVAEVRRKKVTKELIKKYHPELIPPENMRKHK